MRCHHNMSAQLCHLKVLFKIIPSFAPLLCASCLAAEFCCFSDGPKLNKNLVWAPCWLQNGWPMASIPHNPHEGWGLICRHSQCVCKSAEILCRRSRKADAMVRQLRRTKQELDIAHSPSSRCKFRTLQLQRSANQVSWKGTYLFYVSRQFSRPSGKDHQSSQKCLDLRWPKPTCWNKREKFKGHSTPAWRLLTMGKWPFLQHEHSQLATFPTARPRAIPTSNLSYSKTKSNPN